MSEDRETPIPGAPVEEEESSQTDVLAAARRATTEDAVNDGDAEVSAETADPESAVEASEDATAEAVAAAEAKRREALSKVETELDLETPKPEHIEIVELQELPSAAADPEPQPVFESPARDGEIRISPDDPMAGFYSQTPLAPEPRGNRAAGTLITVLATLVFAAVYAGVIALTLAPFYPPSTFVDEGLIPSLLNFTYALPIAAFFIGMLVLVLIFNRAGWWAYVLGGFLVALATWAAAVFGGALQNRIANGEAMVWDPVVLVREYGLALAALGAAVAAREVSVWFGAWIGGRGRKVKRRNAEELAEFEAAALEAQAKGR